jgi:hypothetical protein
VRAVPVSYFVAECETLARTIAHLKLRLPDGREGTMDILQKEWRPQSQRDVYEWVTYLKKLTACHAQRLYAAASPAASAPGSGNDLRAAFALGAQPQRVLRHLPDEHGNPRYLAVHPKSFNALVHISARDEQVGFLSREVSRLGASGTPEALDAYVRGLVEIERQQKIMVWSVTHPGCKLPYDPKVVTEPDVPADAGLDDLTTLDVVEVIRGHLDVNQRGLMALRTLLGDEAPDGEFKRASWSVFFSNTGAELGIRPGALMEDWALAEVMIMVRSANAARKEAIENARPHAAA